MTLAALMPVVIATMLLDLMTLAALMPVVIAMMLLDLMMLVAVLPRPCHRRKREKSTGNPGNFSP
jgi:hypothetical protein